MPTKPQEEYNIWKIGAEINRQSKDDEKVSNRRAFRDLGYKSEDNAQQWLTRNYFQYVYFIPKKALKKKVKVKIKKKILKKGLKRRKRKVKKKK